MVDLDRRTGDCLALPLGSRLTPALAPVVEEPLPPCLALAVAQALGADFSPAGNTCAPSPRST